MIWWVVGLSLLTLKDFEDDLRPGKEILGYIHTSMVWC